MLSAHGLHVAVPAVTSSFVVAQKPTGSRPPQQGPLAGGLGGGGGEGSGGGGEGEITSAGAYSHVAPGSCPRVGLGGHADPSHWHVHWCSTVPGTGKSGAGTEHVVFA